MINSFIDILGCLLGESILSPTKQSGVMANEMVASILGARRTLVAGNDSLSVAALLCDNISRSMTEEVQRHIPQHRDDWHKRNFDGTYNSERVAATNLLHHIAFVETLLLQGRKTFDGHTLSCFNDFTESVRGDRQQREERAERERDDRHCTEEGEKKKSKDGDDDDDDDDEWVIDEWVMDKNEKHKQRKGLKKNLKKSGRIVSSVTTTSVQETPLTSTSTLEEPPPPVSRTGHCLNDDDAQRLLSSSFHLMHPVLHSSSPSLRNRVMWTYCSVSEDDEGQPLVFILLRMAVLWLDLLPPYCDEVLICIRALSVVVECLLLTNKERGKGMRSRSSATSGDMLSATRSRSPSNSVDFSASLVVAEGKRSPRQSTKSSTSSIIAPMGSTEEEGHVAAILPTLVTRRSFAVELEEEEQWGIILTKALHRQLIGVRDRVFGQQQAVSEKDHETESPPSPPSPTRGRRAKQIEALSYTMPGSRLCELKYHLNEMHHEISVAASVADGCLVILRDIFDRMADVLQHSLVDDFFPSFEHLVSSFGDEGGAGGEGGVGGEGGGEEEEKDKEKEKEKEKVSSASTTPFSVLDLSQSTGPQTADAKQIPDALAQSINRSINRMMSWSYSPWLTLPDFGDVDVSSVAALSIRDCRLTENSILISLRAIPVLDLRRSLEMRERTHSRKSKKSSNVEESIADDDKRIVELMNVAMIPTSQLRHLEINRRAALEVEEQDTVQSTEERWNRRKKIFERTRILQQPRSSVGDGMLAPTKWRAVNIEDVSRQRRVMTPNVDFNNHEDAAYFRESASPTMLSSSRSSSPSMDKKERDQLLKRLSTAAHLLKISVDPTKVAHTPPPQRLSFTEDEDGMDLQEGGGAAKEILDRDCSEEDAFDTFKENDETRFQESMLHSKSSERSFSLQRGERLLFSSVSCRLISPLSATTGRLDVSTLHLFFYPSEIEDDENKERDLKMENQRWPLSNVSSLHRRRHLLCNNALEFFFSRATDDQSTAFIVFGGGTRERQIVLSHLFKLPSLKRLVSKLSDSVASVTEKWVQRKMSNFDYIMYLNTVSGRSYNDLSQYPVFPWVLQDYESDNIDLSNPSSYRDLTKPMGAINEERKSQFVRRYESFDEELAGVPKFHYGSHYSSAGVVLHYLLRTEPFTTWAIDLQGGRFDCPDRLFFSISEAWKSCTNSMSDVKELIPEFFYNYVFLTNSNHFNLGERQPAVKGTDGPVVNHVELPPYANGSPYEFVRIMRNALESEFVSANLSHWVDLIFGYKQRGLEAEKATNLVRLFCLFFFFFSPVKLTKFFYFSSFI